MGGDDLSALKQALPGLMGVEAEVMGSVGACVPLQQWCVRWQDKLGVDDIKRNAAE